MGVYKRNGGSIYYVEFRVNGRKIRRASGETSRRKAVQYEAKLRHEYAQAMQNERAQTAAVWTYGDGLLKWWKTAPGSMLSHARNTRPYLEGVPLVEVPEKAWDMAEDMRRRGLSPQTINRRLAVVKRILGLAVTTWRWVDEPLASRIKLLSEKGFERDLTMSRGEVVALVGAIESEEVRKVTLLAAYTGLRQGEVLSLSPADWTPPSLRIVAKNTKSRRARVVPVVSELHSLLDDLPFTASVWDVRKNFEKARELIGRPEFRFHDLRHTFATWLAYSPDVPLTVIRDLLGHSSLAVTSRYANRRSAHVELVESVLGTPEAPKSAHKELET